MSHMVTAPLPREFFRKGDGAFLRKKFMKRFRSVYKKKLKMKIIIQKD